MNSGEQELHSFSVQWINSLLLWALSCNVFFFGFLFFLSCSPAFWTLEAKLISLWCPINIPLRLKTHWCKWARVELICIEFGAWKFDWRLSEYGSFLENNITLEFISALSSPSVLQKKIIKFAQRTSTCSNWTAILIF